jgi:aminoglycoside/choline kinase family phosphotransferase
MVLADRAVSISSDELASLPADLQELPYLNVHRFLETIGVPIPRLYADGSGHGLLLLEDVGDTTLWSVVENAGADDVVTWYDRAIAELVRLQLAGTRARDEGCIAFHQSFDRRLFRWELDHFLEWGLLAHRDGPLPDADAGILNETFDDLAAELDAAPRVLNHRDYHSWNLHVHDGRVRVIDFQDALLAPIPYDLATLLGDRDTPLVVTREIEVQLLDAYRRRWAEAGGEPLDAAHFARLYDLCALQKALKVVGRFHYLHLVKGKPGYLRYLPSTVRQVRRVAARLDGMGALREVLDRHLPQDA